MKHSYKILRNLYKNLNYKTKLDLGIKIYLKHNRDNNRR